jgi:hypothetical protein
MSSRSCAPRAGACDLKSSLRGKHIAFAGRGASFDRIIRKGSTLFIGYLVFTVLLGVGVFALHRTRVANVGLMLLTVCIGVTALEAYYRYVYCESSGFGHVGGENFEERYYRFDQFGLRASNLPLSETKQNLVVAGDSFVFGAGLKSPSERFSELLAARYPQLHVVNIGASGAETTDEINLLQKYIGDSRASIPLVVVAYFFNDIQGDATPADRERVKPPISPAKPTRLDTTLQWLSGYSRFVELFYFRIGYPRLVRERLGQIRMFYSDPVVMGRHMQTLERLRAVVERKYSSRLLLVVLPLFHNDQLLNDTEFYARFRTHLDEAHFQYVDMQPVFAKHGCKKLWVSRFDPHANPFANRLIAGGIADYMSKHPDVLQREQTR